MLDLGEGNMVEKLDKELAGDVGLVARESFDGDEDGRGGNDEGIQSVDSRCREQGELNWLRVRWGRVGRFVSESGREVWHSYGGGLEHW